MQLAKPANPAKMVLPVPLVVPEMLVPVAVLAKLADLVQLANPARTAHLALATIAHLLVWLQVIKRRRLTSQAISRTSHWLGHPLVNDKKIFRFSKKILPFFCFSYI